MDLRRARGIFRLGNKISIEELNTLFRDLVKKYHPDKVREHPEWAHERMAEINNAYETLAEWIARPKAIEEEPRATDVDEEEPSGPINDQFDSPARHAPPFRQEESKVFYSSFHRFLDGMGLYYQYGLENPSYRGEGVRRFRFREAIRSIERGRDGIEACSKNYPHPAILAASRFARLTVADIHLGEMDFPSPFLYRKNDERMRNARRAFDSAVKDILFPELVPGHLKGRSTAALYSCYTEFVLYLASFDQGERRKAGILQTARYDAFMSLLQFRSFGIIEF